MNVVAIILAFFGAVQLAGLLAGLVCCIFGREDKRFEGDKIIYRS